MADAFAKLWSSILDSSVWRLPDPHRVVWVTMLAMAEQDGYVGASVGGLADRARVSEEACRKALAAFMEPDTDSRSKEFDGRRIEEADRGWRILNYQRFREQRDMLRKREADAERQRRHRSGSRDVTRGHTRSRGVAHADADADASCRVPEQSPAKPAARSARCVTDPAFDLFWDAYGKKVDRKLAEKAWRKIAPDADLAAKIISAAHAHAAAQPEKKYRKDPVRWLSAGSWENEIIAPSTNGHVSHSIVPKVPPPDYYADRGPVHGM